MSNYTKSDIALYIRWGEQDPVISKLMKQDMVQPQLFTTGYYQPSQANWSYVFGMVSLGGKVYEVMTRFGSIEGGREIYLPKYTKTGKRAK